MIIVVTYPTALEFWLKETGHNYPNSGYIKENKCEYPNECTGYLNDQHVKDIAEDLGFELPVHVLTINKNRRKAGKNHVWHSCTGKIPRNSFIKINPYLYVVCPELCFLQAAKNLKLAELVSIADDLCARYVRDSESGYMQRNREPITTVKKMKQYINSSENISGILNAKRALRYALDNSGSPRETLFAVMARLPISEGGYNLLPPKLNFNVKLNADGSKYLKRETCCCDIAWEVQRLL